MWYKAKARRFYDSTGAAKPRRSLRQSPRVYSVAAVSRDGIPER
jgi:hypothetical protein